MIRRIGIAATAAVLSLLSVEASAWKLDTHILQARMIRDEALTGKVRVTPTDSRDVPAYVRDSLARFPDAFVIGVLGADIYPDMLAGQMTTHPGLWDEKPVDKVAEVMKALGRPLGSLERHWKTDDWLRHVLQSAFRKAPADRVSPEVAYAYGYLLHASMDMWAHSYVNTYTGGVFELVANQEIAARHVAIESFIAHRHEDILKLPDMPASVQAAGQLGRIAADARTQLNQAASGTRTGVSLVALQATSGPVWFNRMRAPTEFVRQTLILNKQVADQYVRSPAATHLWAIYTYWAEVDRLGRNFGGVQTAVQNAIRDASNAVDSAEGAWRTAQGAYNTAVKAADDAYAAVGRAEREVTRTGDALARAAAPLINLLGQAFENVMQNAPGPLRDAYQSAKRTANSAKDALDSARRSYDRAKSDRDARQRAVNDALSQVNLRKETRQALESATRIRLPVLNKALGDWRESLERAVDAYIEAWEDTAKETMRPKGNRFQAGGDPTAPLKQWVLCYGPTFGLPVIPGNYPAGCRAAVNDVSRAKQQIEELVVAAVIPKPIRDQIVNVDKQIQFYSGELLVAIGKLVSDGVRLDQNGEIGGFARTLVTLRDKDAPTPASLDDEYDDDTSGKGLLVYASPRGVAALVQQDLTASPGAVIALKGLEKFSALQNSMTMSRLALLDGAGLNALIADRVELVTAGGTPTYRSSDEAGAVLLGAIASIDGDHQWQPQAPELPRTNPNVIRQVESGQPFIPSLRYFGYPYVEALQADPRVNSVDRAKPGLRLWNNPRLRQCVWEQVMHGPLAPGLLAAYPDQSIDFRLVKKSDKARRTNNDRDGQLNTPVNNSYPSSPEKVASTTPCRSSQPAQPLAPAVPRLPSQPSLPSRPPIRPGG